MSVAAPCPCGCRRYRLFEIATQKGWAAEALVYNALAQEWPHLEDAGARVVRVEMPAQAAMDL